MSVLWSPDSFKKVEMLPYNPTAIQCMIDRGNGEFFLPAGTPLQKKTAEDGTTVVGFFLDTVESSTAILAEDIIFYAQQATQPRVVPAITKGYVDCVKVKDAFRALGASLTEEQVYKNLDEGLSAVGIWLVCSAGNLTFRNMTLHGTGGQTK